MQEVGTGTKNKETRPIKEPSVGGNGRSRIICEITIRKYFSCLESETEKCFFHWFICYIIPFQNRLWAAVILLGIVVRDI